MSETTENNDKITDGNGNNVSHIPNVSGLNGVFDGEQIMTPISQRVKKTMEWLEFARKIDAEVTKFSKTIKELDGEKSKTEFAKGGVISSDPVKNCHSFEPAFDDVVNASVEHHRKAAERFKDNKYNPLVYNAGFMDGVQWMIEQQRIRIGENVL
jgi:hypothetical protein